jgi:hypothetical protein
MLTVKEIEAAKPRAKPYKLADGEGVYLEVAHTGAKYWRLKYRIGGKENRLALGVYPAVRPPEAREKAKAARDLIREGIDPSAKKKADKLAAEVAGANTFEAVAREWLGGRKSHVEPAQHVKTLARMENDVFPWIGKHKMADLGTINVGGANVSANLLNISNSGTITGPTVGASAAGFGIRT